jgi:hypothetical protein
MPDETAPRSAGAFDGSRHSGRSSSEQSPLQTRAAFLKNRSWESVISYNQGACSRGGAQHGINSETGGTVATEWEMRRSLESTLIDTYDYLKSCHRKAPFLFFNGNTFADISRQITGALFADVPVTRRREIISSVAHYVAGVLWARWGHISRRGGVISQYSIIVL